jgi:hypothetical protein
MKTIIRYKDGRVAEFDAAVGNDALELDLDSEHAQEIFEIHVEVDGRDIFSAYHWHNDPNQFYKEVV